MKTIGILGGASWASTMLPYRLINEAVAQRMGGYHSARIILYSMDYHDIKMSYSGDWSETPALFKRELCFLLSMKPDCILIANNTLHKALDIIEGELSLSLPTFHAIRLTCEKLVENGCGKTLFLGSIFTMNDRFFVDPLHRAGVDIMVPCKEDQAVIQEHQVELAKGVFSESIANSFHEMLAKYEAMGCTTVVLACTELPLAINNKITTMRIIDPLFLQCRAAVDFTLSC
ncbi:MAG: amino acid racemase [Alphaproteobacteria bacterium]|nr:amino acid racemase [Alphaproteobacteria bacterium]